MPSNQVPQIKSSMGIVRIAKELRERVNRLIVATRHNPELGIMPDIVKTRLITCSILSSDTAKITQPSECRFNATKSRWKAISFDKES